MAADPGVVCGDQFIGYTDRDQAPGHRRAGERLARMTTRIRLGTIRARLRPSAGEDNGAPATAHLVLLPAPDPAPAPRPKTKPTKKNRYGPRARKCHHCGRSFTPKVKTAKWCSETCRVANWKKRKKKEAARAAKAAKDAAKTTGPELLASSCAHCGLGFLRPAARSSQIYCRPACREGASRCKRRQAVGALAQALGMPQGVAFDVIEKLGLRQVSAQLTALGMHYDPTRRAWIIPEDRLRALRCLAWPAA